MDHIYTPPLSTEFNVNVAVRWGGRETSFSHKQKVFIELFSSKATPKTSITALIRLISDSRG